MTVDSEWFEAIVAGRDNHSSSAEGVHLDVHILPVESAENGNDSLIVFSDLYRKIASQMIQLSDQTLGIAGQGEIVHIVRFAGQGLQTTLSRFDVLDNQLDEEGRLQVDLSTGFSYAFALAFVFVFILIIFEDIVHLRYSSARQEEFVLVLEIVQLFGQCL